MSFINGFPLNKVKELSSPEKAFNILFDILESFGSMGLVHGDFNEFNIMID
jgi:RIO kinase 2